jgi:hypothetical protein
VESSSGLCRKRSGFVGLLVLSELVVLCRVNPTKSLLHEANSK